MADIQGAGVLLLDAGCQVVDPEALIRLGLMVVQERVLKRVGACSRPECSGTILRLGIPVRHPTTGEESVKIRYACDQEGCWSLSATPDPEAMERLKREQMAYARSGIPGGGEAPQSA